MDKDAEHERECGRLLGCQLHHGRGRSCGFEDYTPQLDTKGGERVDEAREASTSDAEGTKEAPHRTEAVERETKAECCVACMLLAIGASHVLSCSLCVRL